MGALEAVYREAYASLRTRAFLRPRHIDFRVRFYPYAGLKSTIYRRDGHYEARLSDVLEKAPLNVHFSLACILLSKIDRRLKLDRAQRLAYETWSRSPEVLQSHEESRRSRGKKRIDPPQGRHHDLTGLYHRLNREYFGSHLPSITIGWSLRRSRNVWGHHDDAHGAIVLNRALDSPSVPGYVVESVLHHEMLHHKYGPQFGPGGRRILHSRAMKEEDRRFPHWAAADKFLRDVSNGRIRIRAPARRTTANHPRGASMVPATTSASPPTPRSRLVQVVFEFLEPPPTGTGNR